MPKKLTNTNNKSTKAKLKKMKKGGVDEELNREALVKQILDPDLFKQVVKNLSAQCTINLMQTHSKINECVRTTLPQFIRQHFLPGHRRTPLQLQQAQNLALLNQNTLRSMPFTRFIAQIRPVLVTEFPYIKNSYIASFTHLIEHTPVEEMTDEQRNRLTLKKLSLQYPELNEQEILMIHNLFNVVHYNLPLEEFIQNIRPIMTRMPGLQREYIENLNEFIETNNTIMQHNPDWDELQEYDRMNAENTLFRRHIYALEHPESTAAQIITAVQF